MSIFITVFIAYFVLRILGRAWRFGADAGEAVAESFGGFADDIRHRRERRELREMFRDLNERAASLERLAAEVQRGGDDDPGRPVRLRAIGGGRS